MTDRARPRRWMRPRNWVIIGALAITFMVASIVFETWRAYTDMPEPITIYRDQMLALCADAQPPGTNGWPALAAVLEEMNAAVDRAYTTRMESDTPDQPEIDEQRIRAAAFDELNLIVDLREALAMPRLVRHWNSPGFLMNEYLPLLSPAFTLSDVLSQKTLSAADAGDWAEAVALLQTSFRFGDVMRLQPALSFHGGTIQREALRTARSLLDEEAVPPEFAVVIGDLAGSVAPLRSNVLIEWDRLYLQNVTHWTHGSRGYALPLTSLFTLDTSMAGFVSMDVIEPETGERSVERARWARWFLATRAECGDLVDQWCALLDLEAQQPFATRWNSWPPPALDAALSHPRHAVLAYLLISPIRRVDRGDILIVEQRATQLMAALERYQARHGAPPAALNALVPDWLPALPEDPISGGAFGYHLLADDPDGRAYRVYSFGPDGVDNGGNFFVADPPYDFGVDDIASDDSNVEVEDEDDDDDDEWQYRTYRVDDGMDVPLD